MKGRWGRRDSGEGWVDGDIVNCMTPVVLALELNIAKLSN